MSFILFLLCAAAIYFSCEYFVNGVEWVGRGMKLNSTATGSILAAFGTALPESAVTFVAVVFGHDAAQKDIGVGSALGGPLVLATLCYAIIGAMLILSHRRLGRVDTAVRVDQERLRGDQVWFLVIFAAKVALGLTAFALKPWLGWLFLGAYALYVRREMSGSSDILHDAEQLEPLRLRPRDVSPSLPWAVLQTLAALLVIGIASQAFVAQLRDIGTTYGIAPRLVALFLSPVATELPEAMNAIIWVRQGRERLALANVSGSMMIQATIPSALGLFFTPWLFDAPLVVAGLITGAAVVVLWLLFRRPSVSGWLLLPVGLLYLVFAGIVFALRNA